MDFGGFKVDHPIPVSYESHSQWAPCYCNKCFCEDHSFMFQVFGVLQKCQLCAAAALQISKQSFLQHQHAIQSLTPSDFEIAGTEENTQKPISNPAIKSFCHTLSVIHTKVMGTDELHIRICALIWGMCMMKEPPSIWFTINLADTQDPIVQVLSGQDIDLDHFVKLDHQPSDVAIASDPYALASFFHLIVNTILECLLGIRGYKQSQQIQREKGILGTIEGYIGTVKAQAL